MANDFSSNSIFRVNVVVFSTSSPVDFVDFNKIYEFYLKNKWVNGGKPKTMLNDVVQFDV